MAAHVHLNPGSRWDELGIEALSSPAIPAFLTLGSRYKTFQTWPRGLPQKPMELAEAGLYYTGRLSRKKMKLKIFARFLNFFLLDSLKLS
jgi:hypothetical protein